MAMREKGKNLMTLAVEWDRASKIKHGGVEFVIGRRFRSNDSSCQ